MLWVCLTLPHLAMELQQPPMSEPAAITDGSGPRRRLIACNAQARAAEICAGMDVPSALLREPNLRLIERSKTDERRAMRAVACWSLQFTSDVCMDATRWTLWLEAGASLRYFNGLASLWMRMRQGVAALGYTASMGIAPTLEAAALLAQQPQVPPVLHRRDLRQAIGPVPLAALSIESRVIEQLHTIGLRNLEDLLSVPAAGLARRFGEELPRYLQRLLGECADPRPRHRSPPLYRRRCGFLEPVATLEGLLFPLRRLLQELEGYLRGRDVAIQRLEVRLRHRNGPGTALQLLTSAPQREALRLFALLREKLERTGLPQPVTELVLLAQEFVPPQITQGDFFDDAASRNDNWSTLLDKLRARLGADAVRHLGLRDDHRPENAWCIAGDDRALAAGESCADRPLWLLPPTPISSLPQLLGTPERIEAGWWAGEDSSRDYYLARTPEGARWWLFRETATNCWYLQGLWA